MGKANYFFLLFFPTYIISVSSQAQEIFSWSRETGYCNPSVIGLPRAKALIVKYELQPAYKMVSTGKQGNYGNSDGNINRNRRWDLRLRFPILNKPSLTIAAGIKYTQEEFRFNNIQSNNYEFYKDLEDRPLKSLGLHFYVLKPTKNKKYFILRTSFDLNGDYNSKHLSVKDFLKFSITPLIGWKQNENLSYAVGLSYGYNFGQPLIFPVLSINKNFNCNLGIESVLPVSIKLRYTKNEKNYIYTGFELSGASYRLNNAGTPFSDYDKLHLFRSELRYTINYEREIHDWLWFGVEGGVRHSFNFNLTNGPRGRSDVIIKNKLRDAPVLSAGIFVVPPRGLLRKKKE
ncbi:MAG: hypothetical protein JWM28_1368 [Chitinophagaceae bacterium]|nr:hypothetical protein [Chitinophagaceae bacterium]